ncbi:hypothetical protein R1flu_019832 [Riccia fluitans]|uniref:Uncharacterized protein n=1 Tax=Riccia fluitans TaxID=41844 RepID=A0ABD1ZJS4_9MARC
MMMEFQKSQMQLFMDGISTLIDAKLARRDPTSQQSTGGGQRSQPVSTMPPEISGGFGGGLGLREDVVDTGVTRVKRPKVQLDKNFEPKDARDINEFNTAVQEAKAKKLANKLARDTFANIQCLDNDAEEEDEEEGRKKEDPKGKKKRKSPPPPKARWKRRSNKK